MTQEKEISPSQAPNGFKGTKRLEILKASLLKKEATFSAKLAAHFADVKSANGQPLNDKRNGAATLNRWEKQDDALKRQQLEIEKTKAAIEREEGKIAHVARADVPEFLIAMVAAGELVQWRKYPEIFFVPGVDKGRIVWDPKSKTLAHRYLSKVSSDHLPAFRDAVNKANRLFREAIK